MHWMPMLCKANSASSNLGNAAKFPYRAVEVTTCEQKVPAGGASYLACMSAFGGKADIPDVLPDVRL
jgi:hypothetical protein